MILVFDSCSSYAAAVVSPLAEDLMISPVTIATTANDCDGTSKVTELLDRLSEHYGQPIHATSAVTDDPSKEESPFAQEIFRLLVEQSDDGTDTIVVLSALIGYYRSSVRLRLWKQQQSTHVVLNQLAVPILLQWEHLLRLYLRHAQTNRAATVDEATLRAIAWDISLVQEHDSSQHQHVVRIVLLRLMDTLLLQQQRKLPSNAADVSRSIYCAAVAPFLAKTMSYASLVPVDRVLDVQRYSGVPSSKIPADIGWDAYRLWKSVGLNDDALLAATTEEHQLVRGMLQSLATLHLPGDEARIAKQEDLTLLKRRLVQHLGVVECAEHVRRRFFGQDGADSSLAQPKPSIRRLHLGRTITDTTNSKEEARDYFHTSRLRVVVQFCCLLQPEDDTNAILVAIAPILYMLLDHSDADAIRWGSSLLIRLLLLHHDDCDRAQKTSSLNLIHENLLTILHSTIQTQRCGKTLLLLGTAQHALLNSMCSHASTSSQQHTLYKRRRKVAHQWLHVVSLNNRHHTTNHMLWGLVVGGVLPSLHDLGPEVDTTVLSLARPSLQALLPLLEPDNDEHDDGGVGCFRAIDDDDDDRGGAEELQHEDIDLVQYSMHVATTICLLQVLRFGYYVTQRHSGKILCTLIAFVRRRKRSRALHDRVITLAAVAIITGGRSATSLLDRLLVNDSSQTGDNNVESSLSSTTQPTYDSKVQAIVTEIRQEAERLVQKETSTAKATDKQ